MKLVCQFELKDIRWALPEASITAWRERFPQVEVVALDEPSGLPAALPDADVFLGWHLAPQHFAVAKRLRWYHTALAGIDECLFPELVASDVVLTNSTGLHSTCIPEHVITQIMVLARNFHEAARMQARREWNRFGMVMSGSGIRDVNGANLAVLGAGPIGENVARLAAGLGMHVRIMRRDAAHAVPHAEAVVPPSALHELLAWADFVVLAVPLTAETHHLIGAAELAAMRSTAYLINIARGEVVDHAALLQCLQNRGLAGAALDVFDPEPLPADSPFWELDNVVITPHISGYMPQYFDRMLELFEDNLERFLAGKPLRNVVDKRLGYARKEA